MNEKMICLHNGKCGIPSCYHYEPHEENTQCEKACPVNDLRACLRLSETKPTPKPEQPPVMSVRLQIAAQMYAVCCSNRTASSLTHYADWSIEAADALINALIKKDAEKK